MKGLRCGLYVLLLLLAVNWVTGAQSDSGQNAVVSTLAELPAATGGVAVGPDGNIFVGDIGAAPSRRGTTVYKVTPEGEVSVFAQAETLLGASGNAFDSKGNLYQSGLRSNRINKITPDGEVSVFATTGIIAPVGLVFDADDNLYVANCGGRSVQKVTPEGESTMLASSNTLFNCPNGIALDNDNNVYVANFSDGRVLKVTPEGEVSLFVTVPGNNNGHITFDGEKFYVVGRGASNIYTLSLDGELEVFAGTTQRGRVDGPALEAKFSLPNDLSISPDGDILYVNEFASTTGTLNQPSVLRKIVLNPDAE